MPGLGDWAGRSFSGTGDATVNEMVIPATERLEALIDAHGFICLAQTNELIREEEAVIRLLPSQVPTVIEWLQKLLAQSTAR